MVAEADGRQGGFSEREISSVKVGVKSEVAMCENGKWWSK